MRIVDLAEYGFNVANAMELCVDDEDIYREVLETALEEGREKVVLMEQLIRNEDAERYRIEVHGLKNAAKQIGADQLSAMALDSETDCKNGDFSTAVSKSENLLDEYRKVLAILTRLFE